MSSAAPAADVAVEAQELLRQLIRFNTVNPPGNERPAQEYLAEHLRAAGFECELLGAEHIGVECNEETSWQYQPEQTTSALICHHPRAKYFVAR